MADSEALRIGDYSPQRRGDHREKSFSLWREIPPTGKGLGPLSIIPKRGGLPQAGGVCLAGISREKIFLFSVFDFRNTFHDEVVNASNPP
jgi:hypothetical protein